MSKTLGQRLEDLNIEVGTAMKIDWQHYRIHASIAAMQAHISDGEHMAMVSRNLKHDDEAVTNLIAKASVMYADALIAELQKKGGQDDSQT